MASETGNQDKKNAAPVRVLAREAALAQEAAQAAAVTRDGVQAVKAKEPKDERIPRPYNRGGSVRFELFLPKEMLEDLEMMKRKTGNSFAAYIRAATVRAMAEDKKRWGQ